MLRRFLDAFRYLWAILPLVLPVADGHSTACRSPGVAFSAAAIYLPIKTFRPLSWAAVVRRF